MSAPTVAFVFDVGSPTAYLAWTQLPKIAAEAGATIAWRPMLLGGVFKATGNASPVAVPAKGRWMNDDIARWARRYGVPFAFNPHFPINTLPLMRGATAVQMRRPADFLRYLDAIERAMSLPIQRPLAGTFTGLALPVALNTPPSSIGRQTITAPVSAAIFGSCVQAR